jgi:DNA-binding Lrp family transcriptional regulator
LEIWCNPIELNLDKVDLEILNELTQNEAGKRELIVDALSTYIAEKNKIEQKEAKKRLEKMMANQVIEDFIPLVDPVKLWNYTYFVFVKADLSPPVIGAPIKYPKGWKDLMGAIIESINSEEILRESVLGAYALQGTEWDLMLTVVVNDRKTLMKICESLVRMNFVERIWSFAPVEGAGHIFRPVIVPSVAQFEEMFLKPLERGNAFVQETKKKTKL